MLVPFIKGYPCLCLILYLSSKAVIKCLSQRLALPFVTAHFSHASVHCQQCTTCLPPFNVKKGPKKNLQLPVASHPINLLIRDMEYNEEKKFGITVKRQKS